MTPQQNTRSSGNVVISTTDFHVLNDEYYLTILKCLKANPLLESICFVIDTRRDSVKLSNDVRDQFLKYRFFFKFDLGRLKLKHYGDLETIALKIYKKLYKQYKQHLVFH